jgi:hypothetical protein
VGRSDPVDQRDHRCSWRDVEGGLGEHPRLERRVVGGDELDLDDVPAGSCRPSAETTGLGRLLGCSYPVPRATGGRKRRLALARMIRTAPTATVELCSTAASARDRPGADAGRSAW